MMVMRDSGYLSIQWKKQDVNRSLVTKSHSRQPFEILKKWEDNNKPDIRNTNFNVKWT